MPDKSARASAGIAGADPVADIRAGAKAPPCPICRKAQQEAFKPFCSRRCRDVDLHRWLSGSYAIPVTENDDEDGPPPA